MENRSSENAGNNLDAYWDSLRKRNHDHSFPEVAEWTRQMHKSIRKSRLEKRKRRIRLRWFAIACLPFFLILSCTIHVDRVEKSGNLVNFSIDKKEDNSLHKLSSLQQQFAFSCYEFLKPDQPAFVFFIFFIPYQEQQKLLSITQQLKLLNGLKNLDIGSVNYTVRESLFSTFLHKNLELGEQPKPKKEVLARSIQATLKIKGLDFLSINILNDNNGQVTFTTVTQNSDSLTITNKPVENKNSQDDKIRTLTQGIERLQIFNWLLGSWKVKYVSQPTYHHWVMINDSLLMCFIIKYPDEGLINYGDEGPDISVGFSIRYSESDSVILSLRGIEWKLLSANDKEISFKNETTPKSANVNWSLGNEKKSWQSVISGEKNLEIVNLMWDDSVSLESIVKEFITKHPDLIKGKSD